MGRTTERFSFSDRTSPRSRSKDNVPTYMWFRVTRRSGVA
jgi:hypothetical protein